MATTLGSALRSASIRRRLLIVLGILAVYRLGAHVPVPGVDIDALQSISGLSGDGIGGLLNLFSGGSLSRFSLFALGVMPYITASIMFQLLTAVLPSLVALQKEGEIGQKRIKRYTIQTALVLAALQSIGYTLLVRRNAGADVDVLDPGVLPVLVAVVALTLGCAAVIGLAELITSKGIGNGISLLLFASILSGLPGGLEAWWTGSDPVLKLLVPFGLLAVLAAIVFVSEGERRVPVQYAQRQIGARHMRMGGRTYLPLKVLVAGVTPVIFGATLMAIPATLGQLIPALEGLGAFLAPTGVPYMVGEGLLIIVFSYLYTAIIFNPLEQAETLKKHGGFIPGVRAGRPTAEALDRILSRLIFPGAVFLGLLAALPNIVISQTSLNFAFAGTSLLIVVGVALDFMRQLEAATMTESYGKYLAPGKKSRRR